MCSCSLFFSLPLMTIFTSVAASIHHFLTASIKISYFPTPNEIGLLFFLTLSLAFSLLSTSMKTLKFNRKKESSLLTLLFILSKDPGGHAETRGRCLKCKISSRLLGCIDNQILLLKELRFAHARTPL